MKLVHLFLIIFQSGMFNIVANDYFDLKTQAVKNYDEGKVEKAISNFEILAENNSSDAFFSLLNIAIIEFERNNHLKAEEAFKKASLIKIAKSYNFYLLNCKNIINESNNPQIKTRDLNNIIDPSEKLLMWQFHYYTLTDEIIRHSKKELQNLKNYISINTVRYAKVLTKQAMLYYLLDDEENMINGYLTSNKILEELNFTNNSLYLKNIKNIFYYTFFETDKTYTSYLTKYEKVILLSHNTKALAALNYFKARYFKIVKNDIEQAYQFINTAYNYTSNDLNILEYLAYICKMTNRLDLALKFYNKLKKFENYQLEAIIGLGLTNYSLGNIEKCKSYAVTLTNAVDTNTSLYFLYRISNFLYSIHQYELFFNLNMYQKKFELENPYNRNLGKLYYNTGAYYGNKGDFKKALEQYHFAMLNVLPNVNTKDVYADLNYNNCTDYLAIIEYLNAKGEAFHQLSKQQKNNNEEIRDLKESLKNLNLSIEQMYRYKMQLSTEEQMYLYSDLRSLRYPNIIMVCLELYNITGDTYYSHLAFRYAEQARATVMLSMLRGNNGSKIGLIPAKLRNLEDSINLQISLLNQRLTTKNEGREKYILNSQIDALASKRAELEQIYKKQYPSYYNLKYSSETINPVQFQASLADNECVVEYLLNRNFLISFYIDKKNLIFHTDTLLNVDLSALADRFYNRTNHFSTGSYKLDSIKQFADDAQKLYNILLKPFEQKLKGKKLIVIAENSLSKIPFEVLLTEKPVNYTGYRNLPYLIKQNTVYYAPSVTFLDELREKPRIKHKARLLAVAPVYSSLKLNDTISRMLLAVRSDTSLFGSLPNAKKEIAFAHSLAGGRRLFEKRATETRFKKMAGDYDILHLATHGILNTEASLQSKLLFSESDPYDDGFLHNYEIYNLKQSTQLVILSACNTGAGKNYGGEGVISTGRGFLSSGSRSVIMTLWPVNDLASFELIKGFYKGLKKDMDISDALRKSKLSYLGKADNMHSHPFFWTGYVIYGDASINLTLQNDKFLYIGIVIGMLILILVIWKFNVILSVILKLSTNRKIVKQPND